MTDADLRNIVGNVHTRYGQVLGELSATNSKLADLTQATNEATRATWATNANVAALTQRVDDQTRRLCAVERWQDEKDDLVTATGRHDITELRRQLAEREAERKQRRSMVVKWAAGIIGTVVAGSVLAWATSVLAGCI